MIENGCKKGKINYTRQGARDAAARIRHKGSKSYAYECDECQAWHISSQEVKNEYKRKKIPKARRKRGWRDEESLV